jgi:hypothetical protein
MSDDTLRIATSPEELAELMGEDYDEAAEPDTIITRCPAHNDTNPSLVVSLGKKRSRKGKLLLHCRAGCSHMEVLGALIGMRIAIDDIREGDPVNDLDEALEKGGAGPVGTGPGGADGGGGGQSAASGGGAQTGSTAAGDGADGGEDDEDDDEGGGEDEEGDDDEEEKPDPTRREQFRQAGQLWAAAVDIKGTLLETTYLTQERGLPLPGAWFDAVRESDAVRFSLGGPLTTQRGSETGPCMIARITRANGRVIGYQITPLDATGRKTGRFIIGQWKSGAIKIHQPSARPNDPRRPALILSEGLETGLSRLTLEDQPLDLWVLVSDLPKTAGAWAESLTLERLKRVEGAIDYRTRWSHVELAIDRDKEPDRHVPARKINAATGLAVRCLLTPAKIAGKGADLNDLLRHGGWMDLLAAQVCAPELSSGYAVMTAPKQEGALANEIVRLAWRNATGRTRVAQNDSLYQWDEQTCRWTEVNPTLLENEIHATILRSFEIGSEGRLLPWHKSDDNMVLRVCRRAIRLAAEPALTQRGAWVYRLLPTGGTELLDDWLVFAGGRMLNIRTREIVTAGQDVFALNVINADLDRLSDEPRRFEAMLRETFITVDGFTEEDVETQIAKVYEIIGYAVSSGRLGLQRLIFLIGAAGAGKGVLERILESLLGAGCAVSSISSLGGPHGMVNLVGAGVIKLSDVRGDFWHRSETGQRALGNLLRITGGDPVLINPKNKPEFSAVLTECVIAVANEISSFLVDGHQAIGRRLETVEFGPRLGEEVNRNLADEIIAIELSGIVGRALDGLDRLRAHGGFSTSRGTQNSRATALRKIEPIRRFLDYLIIKPEEFLTRDELYRGYRCWLEVEGLQHPLSQQTFVDQLRNALLVVHEIWVPADRVRRRVAGKQLGIWPNLTWHPDTPEEIRKHTARIRPLIEDLDEALKNTDNVINLLRKNRQS